MRHRHLYISVLCLFTLFAAGFRGFFSFTSETIETEEEEIVEVKNGVVPFQHLFEQYADSIGWDWQLLAALCYEESHFNPHAVSHQGATGLMQLMPKTAEGLGLNDSTILVPEDNIRAAAKYIKKLKKTFYFISDTREQSYFVLASYNAGPAHIMDARRLAKRYGRSPYVWFDNTEFWLRLLQSESYGTDSVVLYGTFANSYETVEYVEKVIRTERRFKELE